MEPDTPSTSYLNALDATFLNRLLCPLVQPGLTDHALAKRILERSQSFSDRLPLLKLAQHRVQNGYGTGQIPIVYAQPLPPTTVSPSVVASPQLTTNSSFTTVVQAKFIQSAPSSPTIFNNTVHSTSSNYTSHSVISNNTIHPTSSNNPIHPTSSQTPERSESSNWKSPVPEAISPLPDPAPMTFVQESAQSNSLPSLGVTEVPVVETSEIKRSPVPIPRNDGLPMRRVLPPHQPAQRVSEGEPLPSATSSLPIPSLSPPNRNSTSVASSNLIETTVVSQHPIVYVQVPTQSRVTPEGIADSDELLLGGRTVVRSSSSSQLAQGQSQPKVETSVGAIVTPLKQVESPTQQHLSPLQVSARMRVTTTQPSHLVEQTPLLFASPVVKHGISSQPTTEMNFSNSPSQSSASNPFNTGTGRPIKPNGISSTVPMTPISTPMTHEATGKPEQPPRVDIDAIANQVERKLMRRLVVERERRGQMTWRR